MSRAQRIALLAAAAVVLLAVFLLTREDDEQSPARQAATTTTQIPAPPTTRVETTTTPTIATTTKQPKPRPDRGPLLTADEVTEIKTSVGKTVRFRARSADSDEVHVHGYDRSVEAPAGKVVAVTFEATMPGIFEIELENAGTQIGTLEVQE